MSKNELAMFRKLGLTKPGDEFSARITPSGRQVIKISLDGGRIKQSATRYPTTGTVFETRTTKNK